jgi:hypothetical protein
MKDIFMTCSKCGYEWTYLDTCEECGEVYCGYCGCQGIHLCDSCAEKLVDKLDREIE